MTILNREQFLKEEAENRRCLLLSKWSSILTSIAWKMKKDKPHYAGVFFTDCTISAQDLLAEVEAIANEYREDGWEVIGPTYINEHNYFLVIQDPTAF